MDSGVEMGNDSNDSSTAQQDYLSNQISTVNTTFSTVTTTTTTTTSSINREHKCLFTRRFCHAKRLGKRANTCSRKLQLLSSSLQNPIIQHDMMKLTMQMAVPTSSTCVVRDMLRKEQSHMGDLNYEGMPLRIAAEAGYTDMVKLLLEYGADPNRWDHAGNTLHLESFNARVVTLLLKAAAETVSQNKDGYSPFQLAQSYLQIFKNVEVHDFYQFKKQVDETISMLIAYLKKQKSTNETVEALSSFYSQLSLSC